MTARILIIEDNTANMELMVYLLRAFGHVPLQAINGALGLEMAKREFPDLIICDVYLPEKDGYDVVRTLKQDMVLCNIPVVAITALAMVGDREKLLAAGFDAYISKPIEPENLIGQVEKYLPLEKHSGGAPHMAGSDGPNYMAGQGGESNERAEAAELHDAKILVVDDSAVNSELIRSTLSPFGYQLTLAASVAQAMQLACSSEFDLILSDLHMPHQNGFAFIKAVKANPVLAVIPFIFLSSSSGGAEDLQRGMALGAAYFIRRPIEPHRLLALIQTCLKGHHHKDANGYYPDR